MRKLAIAAILCLSLVVSLAPTAGAQNVIYVDADASGADNGSSWGDAYADLQDALSAATSGDEIWLAEGTYTPTDGSDRTISFTLVEGVALYGGFAGTESARDERDWETHETILSGDLNGDDDPAYLLYDPLRNNGENSYHIVTGASSATFDGFTVTGGNADGGFPPDTDGGGIYSEGVVGLTVANCTFSGNTAYGYGGGMYNYLSSVTVTSCTFWGNGADWGGGVYNGEVPSIIVTNCTFSANMASYGGGMHNSFASYPTVTNCTFSGNRATDYGGGMQNALCFPTVTDCTFSGNTADGLGGGMHNGLYSSPTVNNCTFWGNGASEGGGMHNSWASSTTVTSCTFSGNTAYYGGGILNYESSPAVTNCTFSGNRADYGGGMYNSESSPVVTNSVLWGDSATVEPEIYSEGDSSCTVSHSVVGQVGGFTDGGGNVDADPLFVDPDGPDDIAGTPDDDLHLRPGSPCIDAADGNAAPATDMDGNPRDDDPDTPNTGVGTCKCADMGAYEFQTGNPWTPPVTPFTGGCRVSRQTGAVSLAGLALCLLVPCCARRRRELPRRTRHD